MGIITVAAVAEAAFAFCAVYVTTWCRSLLLAPILIPVDFFKSFMSECARMRIGSVVRLRWGLSSYYGVY